MDEAPEIAAESEAPAPEGAAGFQKITDSVGGTRPFVVWFVLRVLVLCRFVGETQNGGTGDLVLQTQTQLMAVC
jgi:hypothetical protein